MACKDCLQNCDIILQDKCVVYTGEEIPVLGICPGDTLSEVEKAIIDKLLSLITGTGIVLADINLGNCTFLINILAGKDKTLANLLQMLVDASCTLKELIDIINTQLNQGNTTDILCLPGLSANPTRDQIIQAIINLLCSIKTTVDAIPTTYVKLTDLTNLVTQIVNNIINGGGTVQNSTKMVPFSAMAYFGPLSNFDSSGKGISALGFDKIYLCNGNNGTPDIRGRVVVAAIRSVPGGSPDVAVDPANPLNPNWALNDKTGENTHLLSVAEMPSHTHILVDSGHSHPTPAVMADGRGGDNGKQATPTIKQTGNAVTGITINATGGSQPHNNIQPAIAAYYIMFIP